MKLIDVTFCSAKKYTKPKFDNSLIAGFERGSLNIWAIVEVKNVPRYEDGKYLPAAVVIEANIVWRSSSS